VRCLFVAVLSQAAIFHSLDSGNARGDIPRIFGSAVVSSGDASRSRRDFIGNRRGGCRRGQHLSDLLFGTDEKIGTPSSFTVEKLGHFAGWQCLFVHCFSAFDVNLRIHLSYLNLPHVWRCK